MILFAKIAIIIDFLIDFEDVIQTFGLVVGSLMKSANASFHFRPRFATSGVYTCYPLESANVGARLTTSPYTPFLPNIAIPLSLKRGYRL